LPAKRRVPCTGGGGEFSSTIYPLIPKGAHYCFYTYKIC
jgi:hypothetical protein